MTGEDNVRCHIMLKVKVDLVSDTLRDLRQKLSGESDTLRDLRQRLSGESGIPAHVLHYKSELGGVGQTLLDCGITEESTVGFSLSSFPDERPDTTEFYLNDVVPSVEQTQKGLSAFFSSLYTINSREQRSGDGLNKVTAYIRKLSGCNPLAQSLHQLLCRNEIGTRTQKDCTISSESCCQAPTKEEVTRSLKTEVFENAPVCWAYLLSEAKKESSQHEVNVPIDLTSRPGERFCDPVRVPGLPDVFEREYVLQKVKAGEKILNCSVEILTETSMSRASDVERILLSLPPFIKTFPKWASSGLIDLDDTFAKMKEKVKEYVNLTVTPALQLKDVGVNGPRLVLLEENNLGVYICKQKGSPQDIYVFDCLAMKFKTFNVDELANAYRSALDNKTSKPLLNAFNQITGNDTEKKTTLDQALRQVLEEQIVEKKALVDDFLSLIYLSIDGVTEGICSATTPFLLLGDVLDCLPLDQCDKIFSFVEENVSTWKSNSFYTAGKNYLLRMCNDLLRRLSKSQNTVFCGRIQLFLARLFPLSEKSGLNLQSQFNFDNITVFNKKEQEGTLGQKPTEEKEDRMECYDKFSWMTFLKYSDETLAVFKSFKLDDMQASKSKLEEMRMAGGEPPRRLMDLQLSDSNFRRHILLQYLILFQDLKGQVKFKSSSCILNDDQCSWMEETTYVVYQVLVDSSSSMNETCYDSDDKITRLDAVKQLFDNFATRSMAYDFHNVIGLVKFDSSVKTLHTFTETLETFKEHIHNLEVNGCTVLYDALKRGMSQLKKVGEQFPDCRLRIICLTDGNDDGSMTEPDAVTTKLMILNIVVDAIIVVKVDNNVLRGISNATGGCCFKPEMSKAGLKLFEMETVLSLEMRKLKKKLDPSYIRSEKIQESKSGRFLEKDKRLLEELKSLHCDPHPFCTVLPSESDFSPPDTPYEDGVFELYCQFGADYPVKPPLVRFVTPVYRCNINSVGRIWHNIFGRSYNTPITMREILDAVDGVHQLIVPEPQDPLDRLASSCLMTTLYTRVVLTLILK
ncbi:unnamed protein product [Coregonus sp. 'balchen']|nr:unnamed protein product [Coregonus sp. 'balchen']